MTSRKDVPDMGGGGGVDLACIPSGIATDRASVPGRERFLLSKIEHITTYNIKTNSFFRFRTVKNILMENSGIEAEAMIGLAILSLLKYTAAWWMRRNTDALFEKIGHVSKLYLYPVKSCKALQLTEAGCNKYGMI